MAYKASEEHEQGWYVMSKPSGILVTSQGSMFHDITETFREISFCYTFLTSYVTILSNFQVFFFTFLKSSMYLLNSEVYKELVYFVYSAVDSSLKKPQSFR